MSYRPTDIPPFEAENAFYLTSDSTRLAKSTAHLDLYRRVIGLSGDLVECGVFKGASFCRFAMYRHLFETAEARKMIGFDMFGPFPSTSFEDDKTLRSEFIENAGTDSIDVDILMSYLASKNCERNVELIAGDICKTVPKYVAQHPEMRISLINLDTDIYEPAVVILEHLYPKLVSGGILLLDDYGVFPGETQAVDDYFSNKSVQIQRFAFARTPSFVVKP